MSWAHILFAVDTPGGVDPAVMDKAVGLASAMDAELELFHCVFDADAGRPGRFGTRGVQEDIHHIVDQRHQQLGNTAARLRARGVRVRASVRWDYPTYEGIVRQVLRHKPDLLIAQSTRKGRATRLLLTQTDYRLIESCPCPLLLIKSKRPYSKPCVLAAIDPGHAHDKPAALDKVILESASVLTKALSGSLRVFHGCTPWDEAGLRAPELRRVPKRVSNDVHTAYLNTIERKVVELSRHLGVVRSGIHIEEGYAEETLPYIAARVSADIVAMGAVSRSRLRRVLIGHTAERVLDTLECDVLIVKPPGFRGPVSRQSAHHVERSAARRGRYVL